jgi:hypothetical protein
MSPILTGIVASGISGHLTQPWSPEGAYDAIASVTLSTSATVINFAGIPSGYKHLQIRTFTIGVDNSFHSIRVNGDANPNYSWHQFYGDGTSVLTANGANASSMYVAQAGASATYGAVSITDVLDYKSQDKYKTFRSISGTDSNGGTGFVYLRSGSWRNTNAITNIEVTAGTSFAANSSFALYGVK